MIYELLNYYLRNEKRIIKIKVVHSIKSINQLFDDHEMRYRMIIAIQRNS